MLGDLWCYIWEKKWMVLTYKQLIGGEDSMLNLVTLTIQLDFGMLKSY